MKSFARSYPGSVWLQPDLMGSRKQVPGGHRSRATPVPIPNTEVKPATVDGTVWETAWESRSLPGVLPKEAQR